MNKLQRYKDLLETLNKFSDLMEENSAVDCREYVGRSIKLLELSESFGIGFGLHNVYNPDNFGIGEYVRVMKSGSGAIISWPDCGNQPEDGEVLYSISFPTGPYTFGQHYPAQLFREFFEELKGYNPKYIDSANSSLYFGENNAKAVHEDFDGILAKYRGKVQKDSKRIRKEALEAELKELEENEDV